MVKDNQQELKEQVEKLFEFQIDKEPDETLDCGHGRIETRKCEMIDNLKFLDDKGQWYGLNTIVKITSTRFEKKSKKGTQETRYYISSLKKDSKRPNSVIRSHWGIENNLHWRLDFTFKEDKQFKKKDNSASNFNIITKIAMTLLDKEKTKNQSLGKKRLLAAWNDEYRETILRC